jgi:hypothetical protein
MRLLLALLWVSILSANAQQAELWADVTFYKKIANKVMLFGDLGPRVPLHNSSTYVYYARPSLSYQANNVFTLAGGAAIFNTYVQDSRVTEYRGWQGIRADVKLFRNIMFNANMRLEERTFTGDTNRKDIIRFRLLSGFTFLFNHSTLESDTWYSPVAFEFFEDLNGPNNFFISRKRVYVGLGYVFNSTLRTELFYIDNDARTTPEDDFLSVDVIRIRLHITLPSANHDNQG